MHPTLPQSGKDQRHPASKHRRTLAILLFASSAGCRVVIPALETATKDSAIADPAAFSLSMVKQFLTERSSAVNRTGRLFGDGLAASGAFHRELWRPGEEHAASHQK